MPIGDLWFMTQNGENCNGVQRNCAIDSGFTTKLLTTETAFALLGTQYRWNTQLEYSEVLMLKGF
jgi:D-alanyl-D-alanine carboxypeptidase/D-alanyl-D-alanine-endopeptidase (penicillin-binding protein 4)